MSATQRRKAHTATRACQNCGGPTGRHAVCSVCNPNKATRTHRDKYAHRATATTPKKECSS